MKAVKIAVGFASGIMILLSTLLFTVENPETAMFEETILLLKEQKGLSSTQEVMDSFPALKGIKSQLDEIAYKKGYMLRKTGGPSPVLNEAETQYLEGLLEELQNLRNNVSQGLVQFLANQAKELP